MDILSPEQYLISKAKSAQTRDPYEAKAWIITAKTLFPNDFSIQFENYCQEKLERNHEAAAKCFGYLVLTFQSQSIHLWNEIEKLTSALRGQSDDQEFYLKMFQFIPYEVQHKILLLTANHSENSLDHCRLILMLMKRFPQAIPQHAPCLLDTLIKGVSTSPVGGHQYREMLITEALPLILQKPLDLSSRLLNVVVATAIEHYVEEIYRRRDDEKYVLECWRKVFETLELCGRWLKWEKFVSFNRSYGKNVYWKRLMQIIASTASSRGSSTDNKQIFYTSLVLFIYSLQDYNSHVSRKGSDGRRLEFLLVESVGQQRRHSVDAFAANAIQIIVSEPCRQETPDCLITAAHLWQLFQSNELWQMESNQFLLRLPIGDCMTRFISDMAVYLGRPDDFQSILTAANIREGLEKDVKLLSLTVLQNNFNIQSIGPLIVNILKELSQTTEIAKGEYLKDEVTPAAGRSLFLLPVTKRSILHYCVRIILTKLSARLTDLMIEPSDTLLGYLLALLQLDWPSGSAMATQVFNLISTKRSFTFLPFSKYIVLMDFIEEFSYLWSNQGGEVNLEFSSSSKARNYGTRKADRGVKEDFKQVLRDQIARTHEDIDSLIINFILEEQSRLFEIA